MCGDMTCIISLRKFLSKNVIEVNVSSQAPLLNSNRLYFERVEPRRHEGHKVAQRVSFVFFRAFVPCCSKNHEDTKDKFVQRSLMSAIRSVHKNLIQSFSL
jgi:hypothetical protein